MSMPRQFEDLQDSIREAESFFQGTFTARFDIFAAERPGHPQLGPHTMVFNVTSADGLVAIQMETIYHEAVRYFPEGTNAFVNYDDSGNGLVSRLVSVAALVGERSTRVRQTDEVSAVSPNGTIVSQSRMESGRLPVPGRIDQVFGLYQFQLVVGRAYGSRMTQIVSFHRRDDGSSEVLAEANEGGYFPGTWRMTIGGSSDSYLIREAAFSPKNSGRITLGVRNEGTITNERFAVASKGTLSYADGVVYHVSVRQVAKAPDNRLLSEVINQVNAPLADGAHVLDERGLAKQPRRAPDGWDDH